MTGSGDMNAFEWLAGGLFFGGGGGSSNNNNSNNTNNLSKRELHSIETSKDVKQLWTGVQENIETIVKMAQQQEEQQQQHNPTDQPEQQQLQPVNSSSMDADLPMPPATAAALTESLSFAPKPTTAPHIPAATTVETGSTTSKSGLTVSDFLSARLARLRFLLFEERKGTSSSNFRLNSTPSVAVATAQFFARAAAKHYHELWPEWIRPENFQHVPFESRKILTHLFCYLLVSGMDGPDAHVYQDSVMNVFVQQVVQPQFTALLTQILAGYHHPTAAAMDIALHCGSMFRSILRHGILYYQLVGTTESVTRFIFPFLDTLVHSPNFDVASDAMECLRLILAPSSIASSASAPTGGQSQQQPQSQQQAQEYSGTISMDQVNEWAAEFMTRDYEALWDERFVPKLLYANEHPNNYMTKRGALQILSTVLLTRTNYNVMVRFVASARNCKVILLLLRHTSPHITLDAFHVFKVFVANPHKPPEVIQMLKDNQVKLCAYLKTLHAERAQSDAQFRDEKALIIATIEAL